MQFDSQNIVQNKQAQDNFCFVLFICLVWSINLLNTRALSLIFFVRFQ